VIVVEGLFIVRGTHGQLFAISPASSISPQTKGCSDAFFEKERGAAIEIVIDRYQRFVRPSYRVFVEPTKQSADVVVDFTYRRAIFTELFLHGIRIQRMRTISRPIIKLSGLAVPNGKEK